MIKDTISKKISERINKFQKTKILTQDDTKIIVQDAYQWVEETEELSKFPKLALYRNWLSHSRLDRKNGKRFIQEIFKKFQVDEATKNTSDRIAELFSSKEFRHELKKIFDAISCKFEVLDSLSMWKQFLGTIYQEVLKKPIEHSRLQDLLDNPSSPGKYRLPKRIYLEELGDKIGCTIDIFFLEIDSQGQMKESDTSIKIKSLLHLDEFQTDFLKP